MSATKDEASFMIIHIQGPTYLVYYKLYINNKALQPICRQGSSCVFWHQQTGDSIGKSVLKKFGNSECFGFVDQEK
jgi:hypothetical protein